MATPQTFAVNPPRKARRVTLQICRVAVRSGQAARIIGIDNIYLKVQRSPEWQATVKPMLNIGGMVQYAKGNGGVVLCNLNFQETEAVPINKTKKRTILATVLRNLKAPFSGGKTVIAGANLACTPLDIHTKATTYKDERGWFGDKRRTLKALPAGEHVFGRREVQRLRNAHLARAAGAHARRQRRAGQPARTRSRTSPSTQKADALFFLHTARLDRRMNDREREEKKAVRAVPLRHPLRRRPARWSCRWSRETDIDHFAQRKPKAIPGAQFAWTAPYANSDETAVAYAKQWNNPRPDVEIKSVDMVYGSKRRGVPA